MILSDGEIKKALRNRIIEIDPLTSEEQFATTALDLTLGSELFELKTPAELFHEEPSGVERPLIINLAEVGDLRTLLAKYAKPVQPDADGKRMRRLPAAVLSDASESIRTRRWSARIC